MTCSQHRTAELRQRGFRMTPQRQAILKTLDEVGGHLSPADIFQQVRASLPGLTEATVYRTLDFLADNRMINPSQTASGHLVYELARDDHHHLICRVCARQVQVEPGWVRPAFEQIEAHTNFHLGSSHLTFFGVCPDCQPS